MQGMLPAAPKDSRVDFRMSRLCRRIENRTHELESRFQRLAKRRLGRLKRDIAARLQLTSSIGANNVRFTPGRDRRSRLQQLARS